MPLKQTEKSCSFTTDDSPSCCCLPFFSLFKRKKVSKNGPTPATTRDYKGYDLTLSALSEPLLPGNIGSSTESDSYRLENSTF